MNPTDYDIKEERDNAKKNLNSAVKKKKKETEIWLRGYLEGLNFLRWGKDRK